MNKRLGKDFTIDSLIKDGYSAVFIATGGWDSQMAERADGPLNALPGVRLLLDFILNEKEGEKISSGKSVVILGGGKAALKAADICLKDGATGVSIIVRSSRDKSVISEEDVENSETRGIKFYFQSAVTKLSGEAEAMTHIEIASISETGTENGERIVITVDTLLAGAGRFPELIYVPVMEEQGEGEELKITDPVKWETVATYGGPSSEQDTGIFRPGEEATDYKAVIEAIGAGRRAATSVQRFLSGEPVEAPENMIRKDTEVLSLSRLEPVTRMARVKMPEVSVEESVNNPDMEIAKGYSEEQARKEADRCLKCGLICYRRVEGQLH